MDASTFFAYHLAGAMAVIGLMSVLWVISVPLKNVSIVDIFWGVGFVVAACVWFLLDENVDTRSLFVVGCVTLWGGRLAAHLGSRNWGKPEDYRYQAFRKQYGAANYWWISFFQVFMLQGVLAGIISIPVSAALFLGDAVPFGWLDYVACGAFAIGLFFETVGDFQLESFKANPSNKGKVLDTGLWRYTRHPNYFGDAMVWVGLGLFGLAVGAWWSLIGPMLMVGLLLKVSGVALLEKTLVDTKPQYREYIRKTSAFIPLPPKK